MTASDYNEKKRASEELFARAAADQGVEETTPENITPEVQNFATELGGVATKVPVVADQFGLYGWCSDGVAEKIRMEGGSIVFGWTIWEWPDVLLTAEFHAVWKSPTDALYDITPKPQGEKAIVFVAKPEFAQDFNFDDRPANQQRRVYMPADRFSEIAARIATMKPAQRDYEMRRATKAKMSLEQWLASRCPVDPLPALIDDFIATVAAANAKKDASEEIGVGRISPDRELVGLMLQQVSLQQQIRALIKTERRSRAERQAASRSRTNTTT